MNILFNSNSLRTTCPRSKTKFYNNEIIVINILGTLSSYDEDVDDIVTYSLSEFTDSFEIRQKNQLFALVSFDYEMLNSYWLTVVARDNGIPPSEVSVLSIKLM